MKRIVRFCIMTVLGLTLCLSFVPATESASTFKVALTISGTINDGGWYTLGYQALQHLKGKYNAKVAYSELVKMPDLERVLRGYASTGFDLILGHGGELRGPVLRVAPDFPKISFLFSDGYSTDMPKNVWTCSAYWHEAGYLAGVAAGLATKTNKIGYVLGADFPPLRSAANAYKLGAKAVNPNVEAFVTILNSFDDAIGAREAAKTQIDQGADIIAHSVDLGVYGVLEAIKGKDTKMIGWFLDQNILAPGKVLTSLVWDLTKAYEKITQNVINGKLGGDFPVSVKNGYLYFTPFYGQFTPEQEAKFGQFLKDLKSGKLQVPLIFK